MNWFKILYTAKCSCCGLPKKAGRDGSGFCVLCEGNLPDQLSWHLRTAMCNRWYMQWWRYAMRIRRTQLRGTANE